MRNEAGIGAVAGIAIEQTHLIREEHEHIRVHQIGYQGGQRIVVAEANLVRDHRVVFVDYGNDAVGQQGLERTPGIQVPVPGLDVIVPEEHLRREHAPRSEGLFVAPQQRRLPHRCSSLKLVQVRRPRTGAKAQKPRRHGTTAHQQHLVALLVQQTQLVRQRIDDRVVDTAAIVRQQRAADLDHPAATVTNPGPGVRHGTYSTSTS